MDLVTVALFIVGLVLLVVGAELLVGGASRLAGAMRIPPLVIGLTVVAYGTSAPELAVSLQSAFAGQADIALGNVVGSNIFNVLFILGASALIVPLVVDARLVRWDVPLMLGLSILVLLLGLDGRIGRIDGIALAAGAVGYTVLLIREGRRTGAADAEAAGEAPPEPSPLLLNVGRILLGLVGLVLGARWLVGGAIAFARVMGVDELVIGLTIVAAGTSLPEVATSLLAAWRGQRDIAVGNVVGSNIFNILAVLGFSGALAPEGIPVAAAALRFDIPVMIAVALACLPIFFTAHRIDRWEGGLFLAYYLAYTVFLVLAARQHASLPVFGTVVGAFVLPITALTLGLLAWRARHQHRPG